MRPGSFFAPANQLIGSGGAVSAMPVGVNSSKSLRRIAGLSFGTSPAAILDAPMAQSPEEVDAALEDQQMLLETSLPLAFEAFDDAVRRKVVDPVVVLLDCEDALGGEIARAWLGEEAVEDAIAHEAAADAREGQTTVFAHAFSLEECRAEVPAVFPYLAPALSQSAPAGQFWAISVTAGGASLLGVPLDARE